MTTRKFSAIKLPHPKYTLEVGCLSAKEKCLNLPTWIPRYSDLAQVIEVKRSGFDPTFGSVCSTTGSPAAAGTKQDIASNLLGSFITIDNARPELFLRRDFIARFVLRGTIHLVQDDGTNSSTTRDTDYTVYTWNNVLYLVMGERLYRRFGLIGKKLAAAPGGARKRSAAHRYRIKVDLRDGKILESNKYQDRMVEIFRRLSPINKLYFRFVPGHELAREMTLAEANVNSLEFFRYVIDEYALDGMQPVPLSGCSVAKHQLQRRWTNRSQLHPDLNLASISTATTDRLVDVIDWLGYQLLSLDCDSVDELRSKYLTEQQTISDGDTERFDVHCSQILGVMDFEQIRDTLDGVFGDRSQGTVLRALLLYNNNNNNDNSNSAVVLARDYYARDSQVTVIGMSSSI